MAEKSTCVPVISRSAGEMYIGQITMYKWATSGPPLPIVCAHSVGYASCGRVGMYKGQIESQLRPARGSTNYEVVFSCA